MSVIERYVDLRVVGAFLLAVATASCGGGGAQAPDQVLGSSTYIQLDRLGRPGVKTIFEQYANHDSSNRNTPYGDVTLPAAVAAFMSSTAGRSAALATAAQGVFGTDELRADLSKVGSGTNAGYLGIETNGAAGTALGGRGLTDPAMETDLAAAFGALLTNAAGGSGAAPDDGAEKPCLTTDNLVPSAIAAADGETATFPYLGPPR
jgi:hypothetical protein